MRRRKKDAEKLRVRILEAAKDGLTYEQIHKRTGASSSTIARTIKGKDIARFCKNCGQTDSEKLEEHHPDKQNCPSETTTLCANCHAAITKEQQRKRTREKKITLAIPAGNPISNIATPPVTANQSQINLPQMPPLTQQQQKWIAKGIYYGTAGIAIGMEMVNRIPRVMVNRNPICVVNRIPISKDLLYSLKKLYRKGNDKRKNVRKSSTL